MLAQRCGNRGTERSSEIGRVHHDRCPHARARGARRFKRALTQTDLLEPPWAAVRLLVDVAIFVLAEIVVGRFGATMELGRSMMRRRPSAASYGVIDNRSENLQH